jgi:hypothetical protein
VETKRIEGNVSKALNEVTDFFLSEKLYWIQRRLNDEELKLLVSYGEKLLESRPKEKK